MSRLVALGAAFVSAGFAPAVAETHSRDRSPTVMVIAMDGDQLVSTTRFWIDVAPVPGSVVQPLWRATRQSGSATAASESRSCPAITEAMDALSEMDAPDIDVPHSSSWGQERPIGMTVKDGVDFEIVLAGQTTDTATVQMRLRTNAGVFANWARTTEQALEGCWTPQI